MKKILLSFSILLLAGCQLQLPMSEAPEADLEGLDEIRAEVLKLKDEYAAQRQELQVLHSLLQETVSRQIEALEFEMNEKVEAEAQAKAEEAIAAIQAETEQDDSKRLWKIFSTDFTLNTLSGEFWGKAPGISHQACYVSDPAKCVHVFQFRGDYQTFLANYYRFALGDVNPSPEEVAEVLSNVPYGAENVHTERHQWTFGHIFYEGTQYFTEQNGVTLVVDFASARDDSISKAEVEHLLQFIGFEE